MQGTVARWRTPENVVMLVDVLAVYTLEYLKILKLNGYDIYHHV